MWLPANKFDHSTPKIQRNVISGVIRVRLYPAKGVQTMAPHTFLSRPIKGRYTAPLKHKLTHYAGIGPYADLTHPTRAVVGTVDYFQCATAGPADLDFMFEYYHNVIRPRTHIVRKEKRHLNPEARMREPDSSVERVRGHPSGQAAPNSGYSGRRVPPSSSASSNDLYSFISKIRGQLKALSQEQTFLNESSISLDASLLARKRELDAEIAVLEAQKKRYKALLRHETA
ncbi:hypothetical protein JB92DRAFT_262275 [Gautieria morchelliformis]|nr:hypothetical protein JB92DRAFT_262275 [Gautieria morchelliformis]